MIVSENTKSKTGKYLAKELGLTSSRFKEKKMSSNA
jgi:hypothetical protein